MKNNDLKTTLLLIDSEKRYEMQRLRLAEIQNKYTELKKEYADLRGRFTKLSRDNKVQIAETNWLDALVTYFRDGQHEEDKEAVNELQDEFYQVRKEVARRNKADNITSDKIL